jgi:hypothetical protein
MFAPLILCHETMKGIKLKNVSCLIKKKKNPYNQFYQ